MDAASLVLSDDDDDQSLFGDREFEASQLCIPSSPEQVSFGNGAVYSAASPSLLTAEHDLSASQLLSVSFDFDSLVGGSSTVRHTPSSPSLSRDDWLDTPGTSHARSSSVSTLLDDDVIDVDMVTNHAPFPTCVPGTGATEGLIDDHQAINRQLAEYMVGVSAELDGSTGTDTFPSTVITDGEHDDHIDHASLDLFGVEVNDHIPPSHQLTGDEFPRALGKDHELLHASPMVWTSEVAPQDISQLPRRLDQDPPSLARLLPFVRLANSDRMPKLATGLGFSLQYGTTLMEAVKQHLSVTGEDITLAPRSNPDVLRINKIKFVEKALQLLVAEKWGEKWFSSSSPSNRHGQAFWPKDSTLILLKFVPIIYRAHRNIETATAAWHRSRQAELMVTVRSRHQPHAEEPEYDSDSGSHSQPDSEVNHEPPLTTEICMAMTGPLHVPTPQNSWSHHYVPSSAGRPQPPSVVWKTLSVTIKDLAEKHEYPANAELTFSLNVMNGYERVHPPITLRCQLCNGVDAIYERFLAIAKRHDAPGPLHMYIPTGLMVVMDVEQWKWGVRQVFLDDAMERFVKLRVDWVEPGVVN